VIGGAWSDDALTKATELLALVLFTRRCVGTRWKRPMLSTIADTIPLGIGIAINPIAVVAGILLLASAKARANGIAFMLGWIIGLTLLLAVALYVHQEASQSPDTPRDFFSYLQIGLGLVLIGAGVRELFFAPARDPGPPRWLRLIDQIGVLRAAGLGLFLSVVSLKNIALVIGAATLIGQAGLAVRGIVVAAAIFVIVSTVGILVPLLVRLLGGDGAAARLAAWQQWLVISVNRITAIVMLIFGVVMIGKSLVALA
jgi:hypothetical protein